MMKCNVFQPPKSILAQVQMRNKVPIHSISFNCNDVEANRFLFELARVTGGRYHSYSEDGDDNDNEPTEEQPDRYEVDVRLLTDYGIHCSCTYWCFCAW